MISPDTLRNIPTKQIRMYGMAVSSVLVLGSGAFAVESYMSRRDEIKREEAQYLEAEEQHERLSELRRGLQETAGRYDELPQDDEGVIAPATVNELASELTKLADRAGIRTRNIREVAGGASAEGVSIVGEFSGLYGSFESFFRTVHVRVPSVHLRRVRLAVGSENESELTVAVTIAWHNPTGTDERAEN